MKASELDLGLCQQLRFMGRVELREGLEPIEIKLVLKPGPALSFVRK